MTLRSIAEQAAQLARQTIAAVDNQQRPSDQLTMSTRTSTRTTKGTTASLTPATSNKQPSATSPPTGGQQQNQAGGNPGGGNGPGGNGGGGGGGGNPGGSGNPPNQGQAVGAAAPVAFALTPALAHQGIIDMKDQGMAKNFFRATKPLEPTFDVEAGSLRLFLENVCEQAESFNLASTLQITKDGKTYNLISEYGALKLEDVKTHALAYIGQPIRDAQNSYHLYLCLISSLTETGKSKVVLESHKYTVNGVPDGPLLLKVIIQLAHIDTRATVTVIRTRLSSLDSKMVQLEDNVTEFNEYVKTQKAALEARGETTNDLLVNLFKGYKAATDIRFVKYIENKEDDYNEGKDITVNSLMELAE